MVKFITGSIEDLIEWGAREDDMDLEEIEQYWLTESLTEYYPDLFAVMKQLFSRCRELEAKLQEANSHLVRGSPSYYREWQQEKAQNQKYREAIEKHLESLDEDSDAGLYAVLDKKPDTK